MCVRLHWARVTVGHSARGLLTFHLLYLWHHKILPFIPSYAWNHGVCVCVCVLNTIANNSTMRSAHLNAPVLPFWYLLNVGGKHRFGNRNATLDASICFAAIATKSRCRKKNKSKHGNRNKEIQMISLALCDTTSVKLLSLVNWCTAWSQRQRCMTARSESVGGTRSLSAPAPCVCFTL